MTKYRPHQGTATAWRKSNPHETSKVELAYGQHLELRYRAGEIVRYRHECTRLKLWDRSGAPGKRAAWYTPDYTVTHLDGTMQHIEVKGYHGTAKAAAVSGAGAAARLRIGRAASAYPEYQFTIVSPRAKKNGCGWDVEEFSAEREAKA